MFSLQNVTTSPTIPRCGRVAREYYGRNTPLDRTTRVAVLGLTTQTGSFVVATLLLTGNIAGNADVIVGLNRFESSMFN